MGRFGQTDACCVSFLHTFVRADGAFALGWCVTSFACSRLRDWLLRSRPGCGLPRHWKHQPRRSDGLCPYLWPLDLPDLHGVFGANRADGHQRPHARFGQRFHPELPSGMRPGMQAFGLSFFNKDLQTIEGEDTGGTAQTSSAGQRNRSWTSCWKLVHGYLVGT